MSDPFIGEIRMFAGNFAPRGWAFCDGQLLAVSQNDALFSLFGTTYGGDGRTTFGLPDLRGRIPIHAGTGPGLSSRVLGNRGGQEAVTLTPNQLPAHTHALQAARQPATDALPEGKVTARTDVDIYVEREPPATSMNESAITRAGGSQAHPNLLPFQCVYFIVALVGIYPPRH